MSQGGGCRTNAKQVEQQSRWVEKGGGCPSPGGDQMEDGAIPGQVEAAVRG
jgi:hypothetical protein